MSDDDKDQPKGSQHKGIGKWVDKLNKFQIFLAALTAVVAAVGLLGAAVYTTRSFWMQVFDGSGPQPVPHTSSQNTLSAVPSLSSPSATSTSGSSKVSSQPPPRTSAPATASAPVPLNLGNAQISKIIPANGASCIGTSVEVTVMISNASSADRELWLMAIVMTGTPIHPVYFAKQQLINSSGSQKATIQFMGAALGSMRNLVIVSSARGSFDWLQQNLAHDGDASWDINRVRLPSDVNEISPPYEVTREC